MIQHQSDYGYDSPAISMRCVACGSHELNCCDGYGNKGRKPPPKWVREVMKRPYAVLTPMGDTLYFADKREAQITAHALRGRYTVFNLQARAWLTIGVLFELPEAAQ